MGRPTSKPSKRPLLRSNEPAGSLGVSERHVFNLKKEGRIPAVTVRIVPGIDGLAVTTKVVWDGEERVELRQLMRRGRGKDGGEEEKTRVEEAAEVLKSILADGPVAANEVEKRLTAAGFGRRAKDKAVAILGAEKKQVWSRSRGTNIWVWSLPEEKENGKADKHTEQKTSAEV